MKIVVTDTTNAVGYALLQDTWSLKKGKILTHEDIMLLKQFGINKICVAQKEDEDVMFKLQEEILDEMGIKK